MSLCMNRDCLVESTVLIAPGTLCLNHQWHLRLDVSTPSLHENWKKWKPKCGEQPNFQLSSKISNAEDSTFSTGDSNASCFTKDPWLVVGSFWWFEGVVVLVQPSWTMWNACWWVWEWACPAKRNVLFASSLKGTTDFALHVDHCDNASETVR